MTQTPAERYEHAKKIARIILELDPTIFDGIMKTIPDDYAVHVYPENESVTKWDIAYTWLLERIEAVK